MNRQLQHPEVQKNLTEREVVLLCDGIQGPANIGSIFRLCDAFGVSKVYFTEAVDTGSGRLRKTARSTHTWVPYQDLADARDVASSYKDKGFKLIALEITAHSQALRELPKTKAVCLIIGGEMHGVSAQLLELTDQTVHIELFGQNSSMNVAQATAIMLYQIRTD